MLVLRRKKNQAIIIDGVIAVHLLGIEGDRVKIGITAPPEVSIVREELLGRDQQPAVSTLPQSSDTVPSADKTA
jgi:carbon storage regulator